MKLYLGRTRKYITLVMDMESARIIWVGEGRGAEALREFWRRFKLSGARLKAVAMDMSGAYACSVRAHAPHAILTFDRFHVMKLMNERLDDLRRELARETRDRTVKEAIKGLRWLLLHRRDNLEKDAAKRLERSLEINQPLQCAVYCRFGLSICSHRFLAARPAPRYARCYSWHEIASKRSLLSGLVVPGLQLSFAPCFQPSLSRYGYRIPAHPPRYPEHTRARS